MPTPSAGNGVKNESTLTASFVKGLKFSHVAMFIAGVAVANISIVFALIVTAALVLILSQQSAPQQPTAKPAGPVKLAGPEIAPREPVKAERPTIPQREPKTADHTPTPPPHRRHTHSGHSETKDSVIPVHSRIHKVERNVDEQYAFRPYS